MNVIALWGRSKVGKTSTLNIVINILINELGARKRAEYIAYNKVDTRVVLEINGKIIVVFTGGDDRRIMEENFSFVETQQYDLLICACRSKGASCHSIEQRFSKEQILWFGQSRVSGLDGREEQLKVIRNQENEYLAKSIVQAAKNILSIWKWRIKNEKDY